MLVALLVFKPVGSARKSASGLTGTASFAMWSPLAGCAPEDVGPTIIGPKELITNCCRQGLRLRDGTVRWRPFALKVFRARSLR
jgi:hypothetical protein